MTHCFWGFAINIVIGTYVLLTCDNVKFLIKFKNCNITWT